MEIKRKKFTVLGMGKSGIAVAKKIKSLGGKVFISDNKEKSKIDFHEFIESNFNCEFAGNSDKCLIADHIIISPGFPLNTSIIEKAKAKNIEILSEIEFAYRIKHKNSKIIAVTGTNGKSTVVSLIKYIFSCAGKKVLIAGNIGYALSNFEIEKDIYEYIILELSSFQLEAISSFKAEVALLLNITPDHLDRYANVEEYAQVKFNIFNNQNEKDYAVLNSKNSYAQKYYKGKAKLIDFKETVKIENKNIYINDKPIKYYSNNLIGKHNLINIGYALLACLPYIKDFKILEKAINSFMPLEHRLEFVREIKGIKFYNDSKSTTVESTKIAIESFERKIILILGGSDKNEDPTPLRKILQEKVKMVYLLGETVQKMKKIFDSYVNISICNSLAECVNKAFLQAKNKDIILLSPSTASYDMFKNYEERGKIFKNLVNSL